MLQGGGDMCIEVNASTQGGGWEAERQGEGGEDRRNAEVHGNEGSKMCIDVIASTHRVRAGC